ncbi:hypothetical protein MTR_4g088575 [Medicago truncatula]|uniref:Uncharacterized protein n=1 Tax=Medicago truncatula TaxID=3880 RepID=A0A072UPQ9_MEDTR|nr:hypothetical protein MTR_4g088575 [Medicago truncatula]
MAHFYWWAITPSEILLREGYYGKGGLIIKSVFEKKYIGGVEEIQKLHDDKKFEKLLYCCERIDDIEGGDVDVRLVVI